MLRYFLPPSAEYGGVLHCTPLSAAAPLAAEQQGFVQRHISPIQAIRAIDPGLSRPSSEEVHPHPCSPLDWPVANRRPGPACSGSRGAPDQSQRPSRKSQVGAGCTAPAHRSRPCKTLACSAGLQGPRCRVGCRAHAAGWREERGCRGWRCRGVMQRTMV